MSWLSSGMKGFGKALPGIAKVALPIGLGLALPGVGTALGGALGGVLGKVGGAGVGKLLASGAGKAIGGLGKYAVNNAGSLLGAAGQISAMSDAKNAARAQSRTLDNIVSAGQDAGNPYSAQYAGAAPGAQIPMGLPPASRYMAAEGPMALPGAPIPRYGNGIARGRSSLRRGLA